MKYFIALVDNNAYWNLEENLTWQEIKIIIILNKYAFQVSTQVKIQVEISKELTSQSEGV